MASAFLARGATNHQLGSCGKTDRDHVRCRSLTHVQIAVPVASAAWADDRQTFHLAAEFVDPVFHRVAEHSSVQ
jgi:hypothetical protein